MCIVEYDISLYLFPPYLIVSVFSTPQTARYPSTCLTPYLSVRLCMRPFIWLYIYTICIRVYTSDFFLYFFLFISLSCLSVHLSVCLSIYLSICNCVQRLECNVKCLWAQKDETIRDYQVFWKTNTLYIFWRFFSKVKITILHIDFYKYFRKCFIKWLG